MLQHNNIATKTATVVGEHGEQYSQEVEDAVHAVLRDIGYWDTTWKLQRDHLRDFQVALNKVLLPGLRRTE